MNRAITLLAVVVAAAAACGPNGPQSAGSLTTSTSSETSTTTPSTPTSSTTTSSTQASDTTAAPGTTTSAPEDPGSTTTTAPASAGNGPTTITVYFLDDGARAVPVERTVTSPAVADAAMEAIIDGPTSSEHEAGLATAMPPDALVLGLTVDDGTATVDLSREAEAGGGSSAILGRLAQVVYTLTEFPTVERVQILLDGENVEHFSGEGVLVGDPLTRATFLDAIPIGDPLTDGATAVWDGEDLPPAPVGGPDTRLVVLVAEDDTLNVRSGPGVDEPVIGELVPGAAVVLAGDSSRVGSSTWVTVETPAGPGWVNDFFLTPSAPDSALSGDDEPGAVLEELADRFAAGADFSHLVSERGLWVAHHASPIRFSQSELDGIMDSEETYRWGSNALGPDSPELEPRTFSEAIAERFVDAYSDDDSRIAAGEIIEGPNGRTPQHALPTVFEGFPFYTVFDPGDDPRYDGLDWMSWIVSLALEDGDYVVVGLTLDEWAP